MATQTPWGKSDYQVNYGRGVIFYETPGHGGFHVSNKLNERIHPCWRNVKGWYEEDCEWAIVVLSLPEFFDDKMRSDAHGTANRWFPSQYAIANASMCGLI